MLRKETAEIAIQKIERHDRQLLVTVSVSNLTGHKLPTAYPSRRVWIRLIARDASGQVVFESGGFDRRGRIVDQAGRPLPSEQAYHSAMRLVLWMEFFFRLAAQGLRSM